MLLRQVLRWLPLLGGDRSVVDHARLQLVIPGPGSWGDTFRCILGVGGWGFDGC